MQLKLAFQPKRQCVGWEVWYVHLPSRIVRSGAQFVTPELSPSSSFHSPLLRFSPFSIWPEDIYSWPQAHLVFLSSDSGGRKRLSSSIPNIKISRKGSGGTCWSHVLMATPINKTRVKSYSDWPILGHVPTLGQDKHGWCPTLMVEGTVFQKERVW